MCIRDSCVAALGVVTGLGVGVCVAALGVVTGLGVGVCVAALGVVTGLGVGVCVAALGVVTGLGVGAGYRTIKTSGHFISICIWTFSATVCGFCGY